MASPGGAFGVSSQPVLGASSEEPSPLLSPKIPPIPAHMTGMSQQVRAEESASAASPAPRALSCCDVTQVTCNL